MKIRPKSQTKANKELTDEEVNVIINMVEENLKYGAISDGTATKASSILNAHPGLIHDILQYVQHYLDMLTGTKDIAVTKELVERYATTILDKKYGPELSKSLNKLVHNFMKGAI